MSVPLFLEISIPGTQNEEEEPMIELGDYDSTRNGKSAWIVYYAITVAEILQMCVCMCMCVCAEQHHTGVDLM